MYLILGTHTFRKILAQTGPYTCNHCSNPTPFQLVRVMQWFTIFWIPIFPYSIKYFHLCPICQQGVQLNKQQAKDIQAQAAALAPPSEPKTGVGIQ